VSPEQHDALWRATVAARHAGIRAMAWYVRERAIREAENVIDIRPIFEGRRRAYG
jgi:hypothetical protein